MSVFERMRFRFWILALVPAVAAADTPLGAEAFETHVEGKTITYASPGGIFGTEQYLAGRLVRWSIAPNLCQYGRWYPEGDEICFAYEADPVPHCWTFWLRDGTLVAQSMEGGSGFELQEVQASEAGLACPGPDVGV
ncbi:MAG: hypothetical protein JNK34_01465 [Tabrizicola sp.]|nr:hypothetical protein [Tabrizicola sp.]